MVDPLAPLVPGYTLGERLGAGASGTVWAATRDVDGSRVAVKVVPCGTDPAAAARELTVLGRVPVEGVLRLHEAVGLAGEPAAVALVLDRAEGGSLERALRGRGHLSVGESVTVLAPVARALAGLHAAGVVHGDVSPANVLLERSGRPLLADLGVARLVAEAGVAAEWEVDVTAELAAPEVLSRGLVTPASDVCAAGALAWWCVTGAPPPPVPLRPDLGEVAPWLPQAWRDATTAALSPDPADRPSAAELALSWFDSAPCEPLRLVAGADETALLTQRLRSSRPAPEEVRPGGTQPVRRWRRPEARREGARVGRLGQLLRGVRLRDALLVGAAAGSLAVAAVVAAPSPAPDASTDATGHAAAATEVGAAQATVSESRSTPAPTTPAPTTPAPTTPAPTTPVATTPAAALAERRSAPAEDARGLMQALADLRARAVVSRSSRDLALLDAPGSPALATDRAVLAELARTGARWAGVRLTVRRAVAGTATPDRAVVDAVVDTAAYRVVDAAGGEVVRPAVTGAAMRFDLRWVGGRWRVHAVSAEDGGG